MYVKSTIGRDRRRMRPEDRRNEILDAALAVFAKNGFGSASINDVVDEAGITKGCLYHHFASKEELLLALMRERTTSPDKQGACASAEHVRVGSNRQETIAALVREFWEHFQQPGQLELTTLAVNELHKAPEIAAVFFDEVVARGRAALRETLGVVSQNIVAEHKADLDAAAVIMPYLVMGAALGLRMFEGIDPAQLSAEQVERVLSAILAGGV